MSDRMNIEFQHVTARINGDGTTRYYFRRRGYKTVRLPDNPMSDAFRLAYDAAMRGASETRSKTRQGTFQWLCDRYMASSAYNTKREATRRARARIIASMCAERLHPDYAETFGEEAFASFTRKHLEILRDRKSAGPFAANERIKVLGQIFALQEAKEAFGGLNLATGLDRLTTRKGGHATATTAHIEQYLAYHQSGPARLAMVLLKNHGMRVSDLRVIGRRNVDGALLSWTTVKTGVLCEHPMSAETLAAIEQWGGDLHFLVNDWKTPFRSDKSLSSRIAKWFRQSGIEGITAHSVRKWLATLMAQDGATEYQLMAWFGWSDPKEARPYVEKASRRSMSESAGRIIALHRAT